MARALAESQSSSAPASETRHLSSAPILPINPTYVELFAVNHPLVLVDLEKDFRPIREIHPFVDSARPIYVRRRIAVAVPPAELSEDPNQDFVATEWRPLLGSEATPSSRLRIVRSKAQKLASAVASRNETEVNKQAGNLAVGMYDLLSAHDIKIASHLRKKITIMREKYDPDVITQMRLLGYTSEASMAIAKDIYSSGDEYVFQDIPLDLADELSRMPRQVPFKNQTQRELDEFQRMAHGSNLPFADRTSNLFVEIEEFLREYMNMPSSKIDNLSDPAKREAIGDEAADVLIGLMNRLSQKDQDFDDIFVNRIAEIASKFKGIPALLKRGVTLEHAFRIIDREFDKLGDAHGQMEPVPVFVQS